MQIYFVMCSESICHYIQGCWYYRNWDDFDDIFTCIKRELVACDTHFWYWKIVFLLYLETESSVT